MTVAGNSRRSGRLHPASAAVTRARPCESAICWRPWASRNCVSTPNRMARRVNGSAAIGAPAGGGLGDLISALMPQSSD